ncbi:hypothetical protein Pyrfu_1712 [Pyrolobus fumarii 1A]|uniref:Uncharacterized protein n=1 Tax=Pyrolobus fumarii (strain DSM 11204 / 1A) TaxID=694429 RepID=G0ECJ8_PYRF1|nr:hypothetical protein [Pyrolobus fumarii]AEM39568.1 hypothetical protein Pyrfu_1712 [Pyrolobus fumarii 1A]
MVRRVWLVLPPSPHYDQVRDVIVSGFLAGGGIHGYNSDEDAILVDSKYKEASGLFSRILGRRVDEVLSPRIEGDRIVYGRGGLQVYTRLVLDERLEGFTKPVVGIDSDILVAIDWRHLLYHEISDIRSTLRAILEALRDVPRPSPNIHARLVGHAYALIAAARLRGLDKDIRVIIVDDREVRDSGVIAASTYKLLNYVDNACLEELEGIGLDALVGIDIDSLEYLSMAAERRDTYALRHMLRRMGCRVKADELIAPADVLG